MNKLEEAAREFIKKDPILKYGVLEDDVPKLMADFTQQNTLTLDSKIKELEEIEQKYNDLQVPFSHRVVIPKLEKQIEQLTKENERLRERNQKKHDDKENAISSHTQAILSLNKQLQELTKERDELKEDGEILRKQMKSRQEHDDKHHTRLLKKLQAEKEKVKEIRDFLRDLDLNHALIYRVNEFLNQ